jgi:phosphatidate cytidylyltransferase
LFQKTEKAIERTGMLLLGLSYLALPVLSFNFLYYRSFSFDDPDFTILTGLFILTWINDTFAYITGSLTGRHKLAERISPNKTWEGSIGGFIFTLAGAFLFYKVFHEIELVEWMVFAVIIVISGTLGDLFESVLKRNAGLKESGKLIPGHGGILDRIDSVLISSPVVFIYVLFILN